jgi:hypothetical protein
LSCGKRTFAFAELRSVDDPSRLQPLVRKPVGADIEDFTSSAAIDRWVNWLLGPVQRIGGDPARAPPDQPENPRSEIRAATSAISRSAWQRVPHPDYVYRRIVEVVQLRRIGSKQPTPAIHLDRTVVISKQDIQIIR